MWMLVSAGEYRALHVLELQTLLYMAPQQKRLSRCLSLSSCGLMLFLLFFIPSVIPQVGLHLLRVLSLLCRMSRGGFS